mgnify:CR=1 FL=1
MYRVRPTGRFQKDLKRIKKRGYDISLIADDVAVETPNEVTLAAMEQAENDEDMYGPFDSVSEMMEALNA